MSENLLIVESPSKAKTLKKYLGKGFEILASYGHVRDLVPKTGAVDTENDFAMKYQLVERNEKHVKAITDAGRRRIVSISRPTRIAKARRLRGISRKFCDPKNSSRIRSCTASRFTKSPNRR